MQTKHIAVVILAVALLSYGGYNWYGYFKKRPAGPQPTIQALRPSADQQAPGGVTPRPGVSAEPGKDTLAPALAQWPDTVGRNPFLTPEEIVLLSLGENLEESAPQQGLPAQQVELPQLKLMGILQLKGTGKYQAIINGKVYQEDDQVGVEKIAQITSDGVLLRYDGKIRTLTLKSGERTDSSGKIIVRKVP